MNSRASEDIARPGRQQARRRREARSRSRARCSTSKRGAITALSARLGVAFVAAVALILNCRGRVVVCGIGKSGHVGRKLAATLASTGTPAFFVHASDAMHGDLGMIAADDVVVMLSNSGETDEARLAAAAHQARRRRGSSR